MSPPSATSGRALTGDRLDRLLRALDEDRDTAAEKYAFLARRLAAYFAWQRCADAERLADEVMDRLARRLSEGEAVANIGAYALGVARLVVREAQTDAAREARGARDFAHLVQHEVRRDEPALACLDSCLAQLAPERRRELLGYYADVGGRIESRRRQAEALGVSPVALRNRMLRLRLGLEQCVQRCLAGRAGAAAAARSPVPSPDPERSS